MRTKQQLVLRCSIFAMIAVLGCSSNRAVGSNESAVEAKAADEFTVQSRMNSNGVTVIFVAYNGKELTGPLADSMAGTLKDAQLHLYFVDEKVVEEKDGTKTIKRIPSKYAVDNLIDREGKRFKANCIGIDGPLTELMAFGTVVTADGVLRVIEPLFFTLGSEPKKELSAQSESTETVTARAE